MQDIDTDRRRLLALGAASLSLPLGEHVCAAPAPAAPAASAGNAPAVRLRPLPWERAALEPVISARTIGFHYDKHHRAYAENLAKAIRGTAYEGQPLEKIVRASANQPSERAIYNNAAQDWNHSFFWHSLSPRGGGKPPREVLKPLEDSFGSFDAFRGQFVKAATGLFGSGWLWLVQNAGSGRLELLQAPNADSPIALGDAQPLAVLDVWEHAYYLDYQNRRPAYAEAVFDRLLNWSFIATNLAQTRRA